MSRLASIVAQSREDARRRSAALPWDELHQRLADRPQPRSFAEALSAPGMSLIAEHKRMSPSAGAIREDASLDEIVNAYVRGGAAALSILTEERNFGGSLADLSAARETCDLPLLRKDFIVEPYQVLEAAVAGADAILLIVAALDQEALATLMEAARGLDLDVLVEVHDVDEVTVALEADASIIGINNRDLRDFSVDVNRTFDILSEIPAGKTVVAESGIFERSQVESLEEVGVDAILVGEALMRSEDPEVAVRKLLDRT